MKLLRIFLLSLLVAVSLVVCLPAKEAKAAPSDRYWVGGSGSWSQIAHWDYDSGGAGGDPIPDTETDVYFDANSGFYAGHNSVSMGTIGGGQCHDMNWTGVAGNPYVTSQGGVLTISGSLTLDSAMTSCSAPRHFTSAGSENITTAGVYFGDVTSFTGVGDWTLQDAMSVSNINIEAGTVNTGNYAVSCGTFFSLDVGTLNLGSSTLTVGINFEYISGTLNEGTSTIILNCANGSYAYFLGDGQTYYDVEISGVNVHTGKLEIQGTNTFHNLTITGGAKATEHIEVYDNQVVTGTLTMNGNAPNYRLLVESDTLHTPRTLTATTVVSSCTDFRDITGAGAGNWNFSSGTAGDCGGNTNITFPTPRTVYAVNGNGNYDWSSATHWSNASGGVASSAYFPRPQDTAVFDASSINIPGVIIGMDSLSISGIDATTVTNTPTFQHFSVTQTMVYMYDSLKLGTCVWDVDQTYMYGDYGYTLYSNSTIGGGLHIDTVIGSVSLGSDITLLTNLGDLTLTSGVLNAAGYDITCGTFVDTGALQRSFVMGSGTITLNATGAVTKWNISGSNYTVTCDTSEIVFTSSGGSTGTFAGAGLTYYDFTIEGSGNYTATVTGTNNIFHDIYINRSQASKTISGSVKCYITHLYIPVVGSRRVYLSNIDFEKATGTVATDYLSFTSGNNTCVATGGAVPFIAGSNSTGSPQTGWSFTDAVAPEVVTQAATSLSNTGANLKGNLGDMGSFTGETVYCFFQYGLTDSYGANTTDQSKTATGDFNELIGGLTPNTTYHYVAMCRYNGYDYAYGADVTFVTAGAPVVQTGTASAIATESATLNGVLTSLGIYTPVYVRFNYGLTPSYGLNTAWQSFTAPSVFSADIDNLQPYGHYHFMAECLYSAASYTYGSDAEFTLLGEHATTELTIVKTAVFNNYLSTNDTLFVAELVCAYPPYYPKESSKDYFTLQLVDTDNTTILGATPLQYWGEMPSSVYVNPTQSANLTSQGHYYIRLTGNWDSPPSTQYQLQDSDWRGYDLTKLDDWCVYTAFDMQVYYQEAGYVTVKTDGNLAITDAAGGYFTAGIPGISQVRPNLFTTSKQTAPWPSTVASNTWDTYPTGDINTAWIQFVGSAIASDAGTIAYPFGVTGRDFLGIAVLFVILGCMMTVTAQTGGFGALGAALIALPILWLGVWFRVVNVAVMLLVIIGMAILFLRQFVVKTL